MNRHKNPRLSQPWQNIDCNLCHRQIIPQIRSTDCDTCHPANRVHEPAPLATLHITHSRRFNHINCHFDPRLLALNDITLGRYGLTTRGQGKTGP